MNHEQTLEEQRQVETYLESKNIYPLFQSLLQSLIVHQPKEPLEFLLKKLDPIPPKRIFLIGPTGSDARGIALQLCDSLSFASVSVGDLLRKEVSKKSENGQKIEVAMKSFQYVNDDIVNQLVLKHLDVLENVKNNDHDSEDPQPQNYIVEGFPKTKQQALALRKTGIIPNCLIILNMSYEKVIKGCIDKLSSNEAEGEYGLEEGSETIGRMAKYHSDLYDLEVKRILEIYGEFAYKVDLNVRGKEDMGEVYEEIARLIEYKPRSKTPKGVRQIVVMGPPCSGKTALAKRLAKKFGFVYVSTNEIIKDVIAKKMKLSKMVSELVVKGELVPDDLMATLLDKVLRKKNTQMHGYVLDGYPKNANQIESLSELKIDPTTIFLLECDESVLSERAAASIGDQDLDRFQIYNEQLEIKKNRWRELLKIVEQYEGFSKKIFKINTFISEENVLERASFHLTNS